METNLPTKKQTSLTPELHITCVCTTAPCLMGISAPKPSVLDKHPEVFHFAERGSPGTAVQRISLLRLAGNCGEKGSCCSLVARCLSHTVCTGNVLSVITRC